MSFTLLETRNSCTFVMSTSPIGIMYKEAMVLDTMQSLNQIACEMDPYRLVEFALSRVDNPVVTTSFGPYSAAILHVCTTVLPDIQVIWCDTGFNTKATYKHAQNLIEKLQLNIDIFTPQYSRAYIEQWIGQPSLSNPNHNLFSEKVKLEPFARAFETYRPDAWFTNIRKHQTRYRKKANYFSRSAKGILKVSPFYVYSDNDLISFLQKHNLPIEFDYFDPVKALSNRECGIHIRE